ncbi:hypothetical protein AVEN_223123-1 [Araneus ventricosus]|uniref:Uncharacterized protein n=1 Tax=Araneus ventricosus TaxID=182803 RepID=A0A4Y2EAP3_ARAVE|nr:hypothetical protein AVEN_223123-1 [Araneus ventricosus]
MASLGVSIREPLLLLLFFFYFVAYLVGDLLYEIHIARNTSCRQPIAKIPPGHPLCASNPVHSEASAPFTPSFVFFANPKTFFSSLSLLLIWRRESLRISAASEEGVR